MFAKLALVLAATAAVAAAAASDAAAAAAPSSYPMGTMISITNMDDPPVNYLLRFDAANASSPLAMVTYPYYEDTTAGAIDLVRGRYLVMYELPAQIGYYNLTTLQQIATLALPVQQLPDAMHYDAAADRVWLVNVAQNSFTICWVDADGSSQCPATVAGSYSYTADASTLDARNGKLYVQLASMDAAHRHPAASSADNAQPLFVFDVASGAVSAPIPMIDLCQGMNVAVLSGAPALTCVDFITNIVVRVDTATGAFAKLLALPGAPQPYTASVYNDPATGAATFFAELENFFGQSHWTAWDLASGQQTASSAVDKSLQLQLPLYIPPNTF